MKALVLKENARLEVEERDIPEAPTDDSLLIKVAACGICGSDIPRAFHHKAYHYPLVMGHEFSGIVEEERAGGRFRKGDRVAVFPLIPTDPTEKLFTTGDYALCKNYDYFGSRRDGAFAEYLKVPEKNLFPVPDHVDILHASMTEPAAVALHGVRKMHIEAGDSALVIGGGPIGNMTAQWLRIQGCDPVFIADVDEKKLELARSMGFGIINSNKEEVVNIIHEKTGGEGAKRVIEAAGFPQTFLQAVKSAATFGEVVFMGNINGEFRIGEKDFSSILRRELTIYGTWNSKVVPFGEDDWSTVLNYMDRDLTVQPLISDVVPLEKGPEIFQSILNRKKFHNKVIFNIGDQVL